MSLTKTQIFKLVKEAGRLITERRLDEAQTVCNNILTADPNHIEGIKLFSLIARERCDYQVAAEKLDFILSLTPNDANVYIDLGLINIHLNQHEKAIQLLQHALTLEPENKHALLNLGFAKCELGRFKESEMHYRHVIALNPDWARGHFNLSLMLLALGRYEQAWQEYEWRLKLPELAYLTVNKVSPRWRGEERPYQTLLFYCEQGYGDNIQFLRFLSLVKKPHNYIIIATHISTLELFKSLPWVDEVIERNSPLPAFDYYAVLLSLPYLLKATTELADQAPYLFSTSEKRALWGAQLGEKILPRVGICWRGNPTNRLNPRRSLPLSELLSYITNSNIQLVNLMKEVNVEERALLKQYNVIDFSDAITDFSDTAAIIDCIDLVVSVDTAVAHLAGAMNKPVWALLSAITEWRYLTKTDICPWYPSMRLFRQITPSDWNSVFKQLQKALSKWRKKYI